MKKNDLILAGTVLVFAAVILIFQLFREDGGGHLVGKSVWGERVRKDDLIDDRAIKDGGTKRVGNKEWKGHMGGAGSPEQICVNHRAVSKNGESIICLPNQVVVTVVSSEESELDAVAR